MHIKQRYIIFNKKTSPKPKLAFINKIKWVTDYATGYGTALQRTHFSTIGLETNSDNIALPTFWPTVLYYSAKTGLSLYIKAVLA